jgi:hypothetical protein
MLEMPGTWNMCQGKQQAESGDCPREMLCGLQLGRTVMLLHSHWNSHHINTICPDARPRVMELSACPDKFQFCSGKFLSCYSTIFLFGVKSFLYDIMYLKHGTYFFLFTEAHSCIEVQSKLYLSF